MVRDHVDGVQLTDAGVRITRSRPDEREADDLVLDGGDQA